MTGAGRVSVVVGTGHRYSVPDLKVLHTSVPQRLSCGTVHVYNSGVTTAQISAERIATRYLTAGNIILNGSVRVTVTDIVQTAPNRYSFTWTTSGQTQTEHDVHGSKIWTRTSWGE